MSSQYDVAELAGQTEQRASTLRMMDRLFSGIMQGLQTIRVKSELTEGWLFRRHTYSKLELLQDPVFADIEAKFGTFEYVLDSQRSYGRTDPVIESTYYQLKIQIQFRVDDVQAHIQARRPTGWEVVRDTLTRIFGRVVGYIAANTMLRISGY